MTPNASPHFIGWLPMPRPLARFLLPVAVGLLAGAVTAAGVLAWGQRSPGTGRWDDDRVVTLEGVVTAEPYALLRVPGDGGAVTTVLLVEAGKFGAKERVRRHDGRSVRVTGTRLHRDGRLLLELAAGDGAVQPFETTAFALPTPEKLGAVTLAGEIIDPKCHLGAMKPGDGRAHKACAVLCLRGGVPPMFVSGGADGRPVYHLLVGPNGGPVTPALFDRVGEPVRLTGEEERWGDLLVLAVRADQP